MSEFLWRSRDGEFHNIKDMKTSHVFYAMLMVWNHSVPDRLQVGIVRLYRLADYYTREYLDKAFAELYLELLGRDDLTESQKKQIDLVVKIDQLRS